MKSLVFPFVLRRLATLLAIGTLTLTLIAAVTGVLIAFYYEPAAGAAYESIKQIVTEVNSGWLVIGLHNVAGNGLIAISLIQIVVMFLGRRFAPSWLTGWISGILLTLSAIALSWTAMVLDWSQVGYWRFSIELGTIEAIPLIGPTLRQLITGGGAIGTVSIEHLYTLHSYILAIGAIALSLVHLTSLIQQQKSDTQLLANLVAPESQTQTSQQSDKITA